MHSGSKSLLKFFFNKSYKITLWKGSDKKGYKNHQVYTTGLLLINDKYYNIASIYSAN
jgi:hypothetical protein